MYFFLRLIVPEKISDIFDIEFKYSKVIQATRHVHPSVLCNLFFYLMCFVILSPFSASNYALHEFSTLHFLDFLQDLPGSNFTSCES